MASDMAGPTKASLRVINILPNGEEPNLRSKENHLHQNRAEEASALRSTQVSLVHLFFGMGASGHDVDIGLGVDDLIIVLRIGVLLGEGHVDLWSP